MRLTAFISFFVLLVISPFKAIAAADDFKLQIVFQPDSSGPFNASFALPKQGDDGRIFLSSNRYLGGGTTRAQIFNLAHGGLRYNDQFENHQCMGMYKLRRGAPVQFVEQRPENNHLSFSAKGHLQRGGGPDGQGPPRDDVFSLCKAALYQRVIVFHADVFNPFHTGDLPKGCQPIYLVRKKVD